MRFFWNFWESNTEITSSRIDYNIAIVARFEAQKLAISIPTKTNVLNEAQVQQDILNRGKRQWFASAQNINAIERSQRT